jgi:hypothetical protein
MIKIFYDTLLIYHSLELGILASGKIHDSAEELEQVILRDSSSKRISVLPITAELLLVLGL